MEANETGPQYCGVGMDNFHTSYRNWHGYISLIVCILGTIANTLNIIVLSQRDMRSPTNAILTGLAVADLAVMLVYIPYTLHDYILRDQLTLEQQLSYPWACFVKFHAIFAQVLHTISIWLTVTLAVWRYIAVGYPQKNRLWCGMRTTIITIATAYIVCAIVVSPSLYLISSIAKYIYTIDANGKTIRAIRVDDAYRTSNEADIHDGEGHTHVWHNLTTDIFLNANNSLAHNTTIGSGEAATLLAPNDTLAGGMPDAMQQDLRNVTVYRIQHSELALRNKSLQSATFLMYSMVIKLIPCIALTILSIRLIMALMEAKRRRKMLTSNAANGLKVTNNGKLPGDPSSAAQQRLRKNSKTLEKEKQTDRTTRMLLAVLLLFLITEFPQGIMGLLNLILGDNFLINCYLRLSDVMDILALINSSINFILYCSMSRQFRTTFALLFRPKFLDKWLPVAQDDESAIGRVLARTGFQSYAGNDGATNGMKRDATSKRSVGDHNQMTTTQVTNV